MFSSQSPFTWCVHLLLSLLLIDLVKSRTFVIYKVIIYKTFDCLILWLFVSSGAILGIGNRDKEKDGDKGHIMHYKLVVGVPVCLGQWVTKIKRQNEKYIKTKIKKQNEINNIIYMWHKFIKIKFSMFD